MRKSRFRNGKKKKAGGKAGVNSEYEKVSKNDESITSPTYLKS
jgi:hypothetical protein